MKKLVVLAAILFLISAVFADVPARYSRIKILVPDQPSLVKIWQAGIDREGYSGKVGGWMEFVAGTYDLQQLQQKGIAYSIVTPDLQAEDSKHLYRGPMNALGFGYGSMGGYYTFAEVLQQLDSMKLLYPNLITSREQVATTGEGRGLWIVKISNNAAVNDAQKPEVLFTALHHAREPEGMMATVYYMWWLLQHYGTDPDATYLLNNRQLWFLPVFNPDGYVYNQSTNPGGGGYWRKNRRNNGNGSYGVDLNRNYGPEEMWNSPYGGSDPNPSSDVYRGTAPFSEPETYGLSYWLYFHNIKTCLNYHTYGEDYVYPWGYQPSESPDSIAFREFCHDMTMYNHYVSGTDMQTVGYVTRGTSDDYMYGDITRPAIFAMTPEVGPSFWPPSNLIFPLAEENLGANKYFSYVAGQYTVTKRFDLADENNNGGIEKGENFSLTVTLRNKGLGDAGTLHVGIAASDPDIIWAMANDSLDGPPARSEREVSFSGCLSAGASQGGKIQFIISITDSSGYLHRDTLPVILNTPTVLFSDRVDGDAFWSTGTIWGITSVAHSAPFAYADSPAGNYEAGANNALTLSTPIDLTGYDYAELKFWTQWQIEPRNDFAYVEVSSDGGGHWTSLRTSLSHSASGVGVQTAGTWGYDGYTPGMEWIDQKADLSAYAGASILLRFRVVSDYWSERDGISIDDIAVIGYRDSLPAEVSGMTFDARWNLVSLPVSDSDPGLNVIFPDVAGPAFSFESDGGYHQTDTLLAGKGYWLKFPTAETLVIAGTSIMAETLQVREGWNLVGSLAVPTPVATIASDPPGLVTSQFFGYRTGYYTAASLLPGKGYWVKMNDSCKLILSPLSPAANARIHIAPTGEMPPSPPGIGVSTRPTKVPRNWSLAQNYPNPFNPSTVIRYGMPQSAHVKLELFSVLGERLLTLVDGQQAAGYHEAQLVNSTLPSGIYFYRITAGSFTNAKKLLIVR